MKRCEYCCDGEKYEVINEDNTVCICCDGYHQVIDDSSCTEICTTDSFFENGECVQHDLENNV